MRHRNVHDDDDYYYKGSNHQLAISSEGPTACLCVWLSWKSSLFHASEETRKCNRGLTQKRVCKQTNKRESALNVDGSGGKNPLV